MGALWRSRQYRKLLNLIDHLPRASFYNEALGDDEELALLLADRPMPEPVEHLSQWTKENELLALLVDRVNDLLTIFIAANSRQAPPRIAPLLRPSTAIQRARLEQQHQDTEALFRVFNGVE